MTHSFPKLNSCAVEVWEWISYFISHFVMDVIICPFRDLSWPMSTKWVHVSLSRVEVSSLPSIDPYIHIHIHIHMHMHMHMQMHIHIHIHIHIHTYMFVGVNFDALAQASDIRIERRQVVFLC